MPAFIKNPERDMPQSGKIDSSGNRVHAGTIYDEKEAIDAVYRVMGEGGTQAMLAKELGLCRHTITAWKNKYPAFAEALEHGKELAKAWWEAHATNYLVTFKDKDGPNVVFDTRLYMFIMRTRFDYVENPTQNTTININDSIPLERINDVVKKLHKDSI